jgi:hypothetical protein
MARSSNSRRATLRPMTSRAIPVALKGSLDGLVDGVVHGWAHDARSTSAVDVEVLIDGDLVGHALANRMRGDLLDAGIGNGRCAFIVPIDLADWSDGLEHELTARAAQTDLALAGSPHRFVIGTPLNGDGRHLAKFAADTVVGRRGSVDALRERLQTKGRLAVMATFQQSGPPPKYLRSYLAALRGAGIAVVVVDATPGGTDLPDELAPLVIQRENVGWDFASWLAGVNEIRGLFGEVSELALINDSVFGPLRDIKETWDNPRLEGADFWGLTDNWASAYHVQSYFIVLRKSAFQHPAFWDFMSSYPFPQGKRQVIRDGEIALTTALHRAGLRSAVTCPYDEVARAWLDDLPQRLERVRGYPENAFIDIGDLDQAMGSFSTAQTLRQIVETAHHIRRGVGLNATHYFWDTLIERFGYPFVKRELVQVNPVEIPLATEVRRVLATTGYDLENIRDAAMRVRDVRVATV